MQLKYTSVLFSSVVLHAYHVSNNDVHFLMLATLVTSLLYHSHKGDEPLDIRIVLWIDRFFAVSNFIYFTVFSTMHVTVYSPIFSLFMAWLYSYRLLKKSIELHALFHVFAVVGAHAYLWYS
jgi:hypothetical protein